MPIRKSSISGIPKGTTANRPSSPSIGDVYYNGSNAVLEIYTSAGWITNSAPPAVPSIGVATDLGSGRAYSATGGAASVAFTPGTGGGLPSTYTINASSGSLSGTGSTSPITVTGLVPGTSYTFSATGTNSFGTSNSSGNSNSITATTVPQNPTIGTATNVTSVAYGSAPSATLTFSSGNTGGTSITNYKYSTDGTTYTAFSPAQTTSPLTISNLTAGTNYSFYLKAVNANGDSSASAASNTITAATVPQAPTIGTVTRTNNTTVSIPFTAGATGGSAITSYTATSSPSISLSVSGTTSPLTVTGTFAQGTSYTFTINAVNAAGTSIASASSNSVIPNPVTITTFSTDGNLPLTSTFSGIGKGFNSRIYWYVGRTQDASQSLLIYSRPTGSTTWSSETSLPAGHNGQQKGNLYPVGASNKWVLVGGEYGGGQTICASYTGSGSWTIETSYPHPYAYGGSGTIGTTGYIFGGSDNVNTYSTCYAYTGSGSWIANTNFPYTTSFAYKSGHVNNRIYGIGTGTGNSLVYSYSGSGAWAAETSFPLNTATVDGGRFTAIGANGKIYVVSPSYIYSYAGSGSWVLEQNTSGITTYTGYEKILATQGTGVWAFGGDYRAGHSTVWKATLS